MKRYFEQRGSIAVASLLLAAALLLFGATVQLLARGELAAAKEAEDGMAARYLAEAGIIYGCRLLAVEQLDQAMSEQQRRLTLQDSPGTVTLEIKLNCEKLPNGREIQHAGQHWLKANALLPNGAQRTQEAAVEQTADGLKIIMQRER